MPSDNKHRHRNGQHQHPDHETWRARMSQVGWTPAETSSQGSVHTQADTQSRDLCLHPGCVSNDGTTRNTLFTVGVPSERQSCRPQMCRRLVGNDNSRNSQRNSKNSTYAEACCRWSCRTCNRRVSFRAVSHAAPAEKFLDHSPLRSHSASPSKRPSCSPCGHVHGAMSCQIPAAPSCPTWPWPLHIAD